MKIGSLDQKSNTNIIQVHSYSVTAKEKFLPLLLIAVRCRLSSEVVSGDVVSCLLEASSLDTSVL